MIGAKNFIGSLIDQWLQKWSNCKILSWDSLKPQKETFQERIFKSTLWFLFWMILTLWPKSCPIGTLHFHLSPLFASKRSKVISSKVVSPLFTLDNLNTRASDSSFLKKRTYFNVVFNFKPSCWIMGYSYYGLFKASPEYISMGKFNPSK